MKGIYLHIPFCHQICHYCDFNKVFFHNQPVDEYIEAIGREFELLRVEGYSFEAVQTVFLGGGTPTALSAQQLARLLTIIHQYVNVQALVEFTTEANPDDLTEDKLIVLQTYGVNRLSLGVQSFDQALLQKIGRTHRTETAIQAIELARKVGFQNISIDLMYGLPTQTMEQWEHTLSCALALDLPHYSAYSLIVEPKTVFFNLLTKGKLPLPGEDLEASMLRRLIETMEQHGKHQYEISNFATPSYASTHNLIYWNNETYAGIGAGAHGYLQGVRYANVGPLKRYLTMINDGKRPLQSTHLVTDQEAMEEEMFLGLRKRAGVSASLFHQKFGRHLVDVYGEVIEQLVADGLLQQNGDRYRLTTVGLFRGNDVFQRFLLTSN